MKAGKEEPRLKDGKHNGCIGIAIRRYMGDLQQYVIRGASKAENA